MWEREFEETTSAVYDYTVNNVYIAVNNELYIVNTETGEDTFEPQYVGAKVGIRKFAEGILMVSASKSDGVMMSSLDVTIQWKSKLATDVDSVGGIQYVGGNIVLSSRMLTGLIILLL